MNILIIEDEPQAAQRIQNLLNELIPEAIIVATLDTVKKAVHWFTSNPTSSACFNGYTAGRWYQLSDF